MEISDIARRLNVGAVLEGSVRKSGEQVRINVKLVNAVDGYHLWSQTYDRELDDIFQVQADIAASVVRQLQATLLGSASAAGYTPSPGAYTAYLQATYLEWRGPPGKVISSFEQAVQADPQYAAAMVGLARTRFGVQMAVRSEATVSEARQLLDQAMELEPQRADAWVVRARIASAYDFDWAAAEQALKRARELEPNNAFVLRELGFLAANLGRSYEAIAWFRKSMEYDPLNWYAYGFIGLQLIAAGKAQAAKPYIRKCAELNRVVAHFFLPHLYLAQKVPEKALAEAQLVPDSATRLTILAHIYHALGRKGESDAALRELVEKYASTNPYMIALARACRDEADQALHWLEEAYRNRDSGISGVLRSLELSRLSSDARYQAFLRKLNLPTDVAAHRN